MHFIGLPAFHLQIPIDYDLSLTVVSMLPAIAAALLVFFVMREREPNITNGRIVLSSLLMGAGISAMHYTWKASIQMSPPFSYKPLSAIASILVACVASLGALLMIQTAEPSSRPAQRGKSRLTKLDRDKLINDLGPLVRCLFIP